MVVTTKARRKAGTLQRITIMNNINKNDILEKLNIVVDDLLSDLPLHETHEDLQKAHNDILALNMAKGLIANVTDSFKNFNNK